MPRFILRQYLIYPAHRRAHIFLIERSTDSETGKFQSGNFPRASFAQCFVPSSLHNSKQRLIFRRFLFLQGCAVAFWISMDFSGVKKCSLPSIKERNFTPSSLTLTRFSDRPPPAVLDSSPSSKLSPLLLDTFKPRFLPDREKI